MMTPNKANYRFIFTFAFMLSALFAFTANQAQAQTPCATPPGQGAITAWKQNVTVNVMIDPTFSDTQEAAIRDQLNKWRNSGGANVTFNFVEPAQAGPGAVGGGNPILSIMRQTPSQSATSQGETRGYSDGYGHRGDSFMDINPGVTDDTAFIHVVSHEIGHTFGLADCTGCAQNSSAMTLPPTANINARGGHDGPTDCDSGRVQQNANYTPPPPPDPGGGECPCGDCTWGCCGDPPDDPPEPTCGWVESEGQCYAGVDYYDRYGVHQYSDPGYCDPPTSTYVCW